MKKLVFVLALFALTSPAHAESTPIDGNYQGQVVRTGQPTVEITADLRNLMGGPASDPSKTVTTLVGAFHLGKSTTPFTNGIYDPSRKLVAITIVDNRGTPSVVVNCNVLPDTNLSCAWQSFVTSSELKFTLVKITAPKQPEKPQEPLSFLGTYTGKAASSDEGDHALGVEATLSQMFLPTSGGITPQPIVIGNITILHDSTARTVYPVSNGTYDSSTGLLILEAYGAGTFRSDFPIVEISCRVQQAGRAVLNCTWQSLISDKVFAIQLIQAGF